MCAIYLWAAQPFGLSASLKQPRKRPACLGTAHRGLAAHESAVGAAPEEADFRSNRAMTLLASGVFARGWDEDGWRWRGAQRPPPRFRRSLARGGHRWPHHCCTRSRASAQPATRSKPKVSASMLLTAISRNQPVRTTCAKPKAWLLSDLLICKLSAALAWRASQTRIAAGWQLRGMTACSALIADAAPGRA